ncbi:Growth_factor receptor cysteine-rich domain superfamily [Hexamita inflata]|uniref:Growth factor receptor cysteine-rich domain superfamily n=1 Tax=Hexamita inflata TaxID=28002 RepID=A0AA86QAW4_9EUKA|nr:Growth factor receptor cysteine-rich domain superfamily [Hexamita inflata]
MAIKFKKEHSVSCPSNQYPNEEQTTCISCINRNQLSYFDEEEEQCVSRTYLKYISKLQMFGFFRIQCEITCIVDHSYSISEDNKTCVEKCPNNQISSQYICQLCQTGKVPNLALSYCVAKCEIGFLNPTGTFCIESCSQGLASD